VKRPQLPALHLLVAFESAARLESFKRAADEIAVTPSALGQRIARLEQALGTPLFERGNRRITLTATGTAYLYEVRQALAALASVTRSTVRPAQTTVTLAMNGIVAHELVIPNLPRVRQWDADVEIAVRSRVSMKTFLSEDASAAGVDGGVRIGTGAWPQFDAHLIGRLGAVPLCAPALLPRIQDWDDLHRQKLYCARSRCAETLETFRHPTTGAYPRHVVTFETLLEAARAVEAGMGVMSGVMPLMSGLVRRGQLAVASGPVRLTEESVWLLVPTGRPASMRMSHVRDWLIDSFERLQASSPALV
jgi:LysR family transcriptional regulator, glycine cleavage system transcriptional activator